MTVTNEQGRGHQWWRLLFTRCLWGLSTATPLWSFLLIPKLALPLRGGTRGKMLPFHRGGNRRQRRPRLAQGHAGDPGPPLILQKAQACNLHLGEAADGAAPKSQGSHLTSVPTDPVRDSVLAWLPTPVSTSRSLANKEGAFSGDFLPAEPSFLL